MRRQISVVAPATPAADSASFPRPCHSERSESRVRRSRVFETRPCRAEVANAPKVCRWRNHRSCCPRLRSATRGTKSPHRPFTLFTLSPSKGAASKGPRPPLQTPALPETRLRDLSALGGLVRLFEQPILTHFGGRTGQKTLPCPPKLGFVFGFVFWNFPRRLEQTWVRFPKSRLLEATMSCPGRNPAVSPAVFFPSVILSLSKDPSSAIPH